MTLLSVALLFALAAVSMSLAAVEAAFYLVKRRRIGRLASQNPRAVLAHAYLDDPPALLMPVHIGTYTAHVAMTILMTSMFFDVLDQWSMLAAFFVMLGYLLFFRLTIPYVLVRRSPERSLLMLLPAFEMYARAVGPLVRALRRREGGEGTSEDSARTAPRSRGAAASGARYGRGSGRGLAREVRGDPGARRDDPAPRHRGHRRGQLGGRAAPRDARDEVQPDRGVRREPGRYRGGGRGARPHRLRRGPGRVAPPLVRPILVVPETKLIAELLRELQAKRVTFAAVVDEYGATVGVISVEDIVEELVGEIKDEHDTEAEPITVEPDGAYLVAGRASVNSLEQALEAKLDEGDEVGTVGGLVTNVFGRVPRAGDHVQFGGFEIEVVEAERKRVHRVRFRRLGAAHQSPTDARSAKHE